MNIQMFLYSLQGFTEVFKNHVKCCECEFTKILLYSLIANLFMYKFNS